MERMSEVETAGNIVWDADVPRTHKSPMVDSGDHLPSFELLTSDEDRERKAEASIPGTYHVIVVPGSFADLPEYTEGTLEKDIGDQVSYPLLINDETSQACLISAGDDPNVVILKTFRDTRRPSPANRKCSAQPLDSDSQSSSIRTPSTTSSVQAIAHDNLQAWPEPENSDGLLFRHFRDVVWAQLIPETTMIDCPSGSYRLGWEVFEQEATRSSRVRGTLSIPLCCTKV
ncbi:uncharacterized protein LDX57_000678 [Aspergillus melleus]|uniref:uncharacterized protein n=1 Tax=Aspergillus melleus TaxID=138277 RepID=UPI001E8CDF22|nr:uncharacterized protein LDX57_000678 [Aspergillus melleus]KAH8422922.1 hypothetical protein LDX57_000678 [Aspergillus melleus]